MQEAARVISNLQAESDGVDLATLLREGPREAYAFQQLGVRPPPASFRPGAGVCTARQPPPRPRRDVFTVSRRESRVPSRRRPLDPTPPANFPHVPTCPSSLIDLPVVPSSLVSAQWPAEIASVTTRELPAAVLERYSARQSVCFCGVLPEIGRAWATVDNALFLWRYDVPDDAPVEYAGEEQAIVAVAVATPRPGVFLQSIERLIVVATTTEIVLLGAAFETAGDEDDRGKEPTRLADAGGIDFGEAGAESAARVAFAEKDMTLHALDYACVTDDVVVKDFACTSTGRIFFAGDDEALYEVEYSAGDSWRARRCRKTCHHSATPKLLPSILRLRAPDALRQVLVDEDRCALYTRSENGVVAVYDLGASLAEAPRRVAEVRDVVAAAQTARGGGLFYDGRGGGGGSGFGAHGYSSYGAAPRGGSGNSGSSGGSGSQTQKGKRLVHIAVVSARESTTVTLVAVCADGRRVYFTALPSPGGYGRYGPNAPFGSGAFGAGSYGGAPHGADARATTRRVSPAVTRLAVLAVRDPPPQASAARGMTAAQSLRATATARPLEVEAAYYAEGVMLLSDAAEADEDARLFFASRDASLPSHLRAVSPAEAAAAPYGAGADAFAGAEGAGYGGGVSGGGGSAAAHAARSLREAVSTRRLTGRAASSVGSIGEVPPPPAVLRDLDPPFPASAAAAQPGAAGGFKPPASRLRGGELATQHVAPRRKFVIVTNAGVVLVEKARPVDALRELLLDDVHEHVARFFAAYGQAEAATMCLALALGACADVAGNGGDGISDEQSGARVVGAGAEASGSFFASRASSASAVAAAAERARLALRDPRLTGEPRVDEDRSDGGAGVLSPANGAAPNGAATPFDMGRAIVQPRVHFSGVHAAAFTYAARVLAAVWERPVATTLVGAAGDDGTRRAPAKAPRGDGVAAASASTGRLNGAAPSSSRQPLREAMANGAAANGAMGAASAAAGWLGGMLRPSRATGPPVACALPADTLASLERRLRPLERFLARRRRDAPFASLSAPVGAFAHASAGDPKRRRVDPSSARRAEERSLAALRGALRRAAEASALLRVASESGTFARAAARLSREDREALTRGDFTLRRLATTSEGARLASALVEALMSALVSAGDVEGAERAAQKLQTSCPLFFGGDERRFYRARQSLQAAREARDARDAADAERRTAEALAALLEVPAAGNLSATMAELADAGCFHGLVALPLCAAAAARRRRPRGGAADEVDVAAEGDAASFRAFDPFDEADRSAAAAMAADTPEACREYICVALRALATGAPDEGAPPGSLGAVCAGFSPEARARGLSAMLSRAAQASSPPAAAAARARLVAAKAEAEAAAAAAARAGAPFVPPPEVSCAAQFATATTTPAEAEGAALDDGAFARRVYAELVSLREDDALLAMPPGPLERFLAEKGAFAVAQQGGALTQQQARHLELLAKLYGARGRDALAARVYFALAERDAAGAAVPLAERAALLDLAMRKATGASSHARGGADAAGAPHASASTHADDVDGVSHASFLETLDGKMKVLGFQTRLRGAFQERARVAQTSEAAAAARAAAEDLERELRPLSDMFNDFARPAEMWDLCLEMLHFSRYRDQDDDGAVARELWDAALGDAAADAVADGDVAGAARAACAAAAALGPKLFPSDAAFPVAHVALRLELLDAGLWRPERGEPREPDTQSDLRDARARDDDDDASVAETLLRATRDSFEAAHAAYDSLLAAPHAVHRAHHDRRMQAHAAHLQTPALRLRLLRSALRVLRRWEASLAGAETETSGGFGAYGGGRRRARAALADVCAGYAGEARRLLQVPASEQGAAEALAAEFEALGKRLASA